jgi:hypothetical protein
MRRKIVLCALAGTVFAGTTAALASQPGPPNPQPPKCVPASTPGCSH